MVRCDICLAEVPDEDTAIELGWIPYYNRNGVEIEECVCTECICAGKVIYNPAFEDYEQP